MSSGLPLKEIKVILNRPGEEIDERLTKLKSIDPDLLKHVTAGYIVELDGNLEKDASGDMQFVGSAHTITLPTDPVGGEVSGGLSRQWTRRGRGDIYLWFEFRISPAG